jgi:hypothetical protein
VATLILRELDAAATERLADGGAATELAASDLAVFVFDSTDAGSLGEAMQMLHEVTCAAADTLPCVLVAAKENLGMSPVSHLALTCCHIVFDTVQSRDSRKEHCCPIPFREKEFDSQSHYSSCFCPFMHSCRP